MVWLAVIQVIFSPTRIPPCFPCFTVVLFLSLKQQCSVSVFEVAEPPMFVRARAARHRHALRHWGLQRWHCVLGFGWGQATGWFGALPFAWRLFLFDTHWRKWIVIFHSGGLGLNLWNILCSLYPKSLSWIWEWDDNSSVFPLRFLCRDYRIFQKSSKHENLPNVNLKSCPLMRTTIVWTGLSTSRTFGAVLLLLQWDKLGWTAFTRPMFSPSAGFYPKA